MKPVFGKAPQAGQAPSAPFYDPNDLHVHMWVRGLLAREENPKVPEYSTALVSVRECEYCRVCHKIKPPPAPGASLLDQDDPAGPLVADSARPARAQAPRGSKAPTVSVELTRPGESPRVVGGSPRVPELPARFSHLFHTVPEDQEYVVI